MPTDHALEGARYKIIGAVKRLTWVNDVLIQSESS
jgi:hypothetical protein